MRRTIRDRTGNRAGKGFGQACGRGDLENQDQDPSSDVRDIYEEEQDSANEEYVWPENEETDDD